MSDTTAVPPQMTVGQMVEAYVKLRDKKSAITDRHAEELKPFNEMLNRLEGYMLNALNQSGQKSAATPAGTVYKKTDTSVTVDNWTEVLDFIRSNNMWDLLEARVSKTAVMSTMEETKTVVPGVKVRQSVSVGVQRASGSTRS